MFQISEDISHNGKRLTHACHLITQKAESEGQSLRSAGALARMSQTIKSPAFYKHVRSYNLLVY